MGQGGKLFPECSGRDSVERISVYLKCGKLLWGFFSDYKESI